MSSVKSVNKISTVDDICQIIKSRVREIAYSLSVGDIKGEDLFKDFFDNYSGDEITEQRAFVSPVLFKDKNYTIVPDEWYHDIDSFFEIENMPDVPAWLRQPGRFTAYRKIKGAEMYALCLHLGHEDNQVSVEEAQSMGFVKENEKDSDIWILPITANDLHCEVQSTWKEEEIVFSEDDRDVNVVVKMWDEGNESNPSFFKISMIYYSSDGFQPRKVTRVTPSTKEVVVFS